MTRWPLRAEGDPRSASVLGLVDDPDRGHQEPEPERHPVTTLGGRDDALSGPATEAITHSATLEVGRMVVGPGDPVVVAGLVASLVAVGVGILALPSPIDPGRDHWLLRACAAGVAAPLAVVAVAIMNDLVAPPSGLGLSLGAVLATCLSWALPRVSAWLSQGWDDGILRALGVALARGLGNTVAGLAIGASYVRGDVALTALLVAAVVLSNGATGAAIGVHLPGRRRWFEGRQVLMLVTIAGVPVVPGIWAGGGLGHDVAQLSVITAGTGVILSNLFELGPRHGRRTRAASTLHITAITSIMIGLVTLGPMSS